MKVGRPPSGFRIVILDPVTTAIQMQSANWPRLPELFDGIVERLKFTGHRDEESKEIKGRWNHRVFVAKGDPRHGIPQINVVYTIQSDTLTFKKILITD